jgi:hypothetical protein
MQVTGIDIVPALVAEADRRAALTAHPERLSFRTGEVAGVELEDRYDLVLCSTVLSHITEDDAVHAAFAWLRAQLTPSGRLLIIERTDTTLADYVRGRPRAEWVATAERAGLRLSHEAGVLYFSEPLWERVGPIVRRLPGVWSRRISPPGFLPEQREGIAVRLPLYALRSLDSICSALDRFPAVRSRARMSLLVFD